MKRVLIFKAVFALLFLMIVSCLSSVSVFAEPKGEGMILEASGDVKILYSGKTKKVFPFQPIFSDSVLITGKNGSVNFASYKDHNEYKLNSSSRLSFNQDGFKVESGSVDKKTAGSGLPIPQNTTLVSRRLMGLPLRFVFNEISIVSPKKNAVFLKPSVTFKWTGGTSKNYCIEIVQDKDQKSKKPFPLTVAKNSYSLPVKNAPIKLEYGKTYTFRVWNPFPIDKKTGKPVTNAEPLKKEATFSILSERNARILEDAEKEYEKSQSGCSEKKKNMLLMADCYKEQGMYYQAADLLEQLRVLDKDNPYILIFLAEMYDKLKDPRAKQTMDEGSKLLEVQEQ
jgi:hypothetical protein